MTIRNAVAYAFSALNCRKIPAKCLMILPVIIFMLCPHGFAQTLDDFRSAAGSARGGVQFIPYSALRSTAETLAAVVEKSKDAVKNLNYDNFEREKDGILRELKKQKQEIDKTKKEIADFKSRHPDGIVKPFEDEIAKMESVISGENQKLDNVNKSIGQAAETYGNLNEARAMLRRQFESVKSMLVTSKANPSTHLGTTFSDEDKQKFENYISVIESEITLQETEHRVQEDGAQRTREKFEKLLTKSEKDI
jgi:hypothetical protein